MDLIGVGRIIYFLILLEFNIFYLLSRDEYLEVPIILHDRNNATPFSVNTRKYHPDRDEASRGHFIVKVQEDIIKAFSNQTLLILIPN